MKQSSKKLVKRIQKITGMKEAEAYGSLISFIHEVKNNKYSNYSDKQIKKRLEQCGYLKRGYR